jgi:predicted DNA-binding transcriptional regulator YafY
MVGKKRPEPDRRHRQEQRLARLFKILQRLQGLRNWDAKTLAEDLGCHVRTIYRDLRVLEVAGIPCTFDGRTQGYRLPPGFRFAPPSLTADEALDQAVAAAVSRVPHLTAGDGAVPTTRRLEATVSEANRRILADAQEPIVALDLKLADHGRHRHILRTVQHALLERKQLRGRYRSPYQSRPVELRLYPYRLCLVRQAWYLISQSVEDESPRTYRSPRFESLEMLDQDADIPPDFDLSAYFGDAWGVYRDGRIHDIELLFSADAAPLYALETRP